MSRTAAKSTPSKGRPAARTSGRPATPGFAAGPAVRHKNAVTLMREDMKAVAAGKVFELGVARDAKGHAVPITRHSPVVRVRMKKAAASAFSSMLATGDWSPGLIRELPGEARDAYNAIKQAAGERNRDRIDQAEEYFCEVVGRLAEPVVSRLEQGTPLSLLTAQDTAIYLLASALATLRREIVIRYALPTILAAFPITQYNTLATVYMDTVETEHGMLSDAMAADGGGLGASGHLDERPVYGPLRWLRQTWEINNLDIDAHNERRGADGAPSWDLLDRRMQLATSLLMVDEARLCAFGSEPGTVYVPGTDLEIPGVLYLKTPTSVDMANADGEVVYDNIRTFIKNQRIASHWSAGMSAGVLTLGAGRYYDLKGKFVNTAGGNMTVLDALVSGTAGLDAVQFVREYEVMPGEQTRLEALSDPYATERAGGVKVAGVMREAISLHVDDPEIISLISGHPLRITDDGLVRGKFSGQAALSTGGASNLQPDGFTLGYQPA